MADGSNGNRGQTLLWQCQFCPKSFLGVRPGTFDFCPKCGKEQKQDPTIPEILCINPECKATLFSEKTEMCHICKKPQQQKPAATPTDSSKQEEHKLKIAQAVQAKKQHSQQPETTAEMAASHGAGGAAVNQSAAEPQKGGAQVPPNTPTLKQGETPENPIVIDSANTTAPGKDTSAEADPNSKSVNVNKSATEGTTEPQNVNINSQKTNQSPKDPGNPAAAKEKGTQDQLPGGPKQNPSSDVHSPDSNKLSPDSSSPKSSGSGVPDKDLARMTIDDIRIPNRKRYLEGHEGDGERPPGETGGSSTPSTYAAAAKTPATATQPLQTSVPPVKKQRNNTTNEETPTSGQENTTPRPPSNLNQSTDPQVCVTPK